MVVEGVVVAAGQVLVGHQALGRDSLQSPPYPLAVPSPFAVLLPIHPLPLLLLSQQL